MTATPRDTRAVVVGVEEYDIPEWPRLVGPARDACLFTEWLVDRGVPAENIDLLLSPLPADRAPVAGVRPSPAVRQTVDDALRRVADGGHSDLLVLYWGGHGVLDDLESCRLFYADAKRDHKHNLDLGALLRSMRSTKFAAHPDQLVFVDACLVPAQNRRWAMSLPTDSFPVGALEPHRRQHVLFATSPGEPAVNDTERGTGLFSLALRQALDALPEGVWPPDGAVLRDAVHDRFRRWHAEGRTDQVPSHFWYRSRERDERLVFTSVPDDPRATAAASGHLLLSDAAAAELRDLLDSVMAPDDMAALYRDATRNVVGMPRCPDTLGGTVEVLRGAVVAEPLFEFLVRLAAGPDEVARGRLWQWIGRHAEECSVDLRPLEDVHHRLRRTTILLRLEPDLLGVGLDVTLWSYSGGDGWQLKSTVDSWGWDRVAAELGALLGEIVAVQGLTPVVEFRMPVDALEHPVEQLRVDLSAGVHELGALCPVVVRPLGRDPTPSWRRKWRELLREGGARRPGAVDYLPAPEVPRVDTRRLEDLLCAGLVQGAGAPPDVLVAALEAVLGTGVPAVLWHRAADVRTADPTPLDRVLRDRPLRALPDVVHQQRLAARHPGAPADHPGHDVVLLWDDPTRVPPRITWQPPA